MLGVGSWRVHSPQQLVQRGSAEQGHGPGSLHGSCVLLTLGSHDAPHGSHHPIPMQLDATAPTHISQGSLAPGEGVAAHPKGRRWGLPKPLSQQQAACHARSHSPSEPLWRMISGAERPEQSCQGSRWLPDLPCHARAAWQWGWPHVGPAGRAGSYSRQQEHCSAPPPAPGFALPLCKMRPALPCAGTVNALGTSPQHRTWQKDRWGHATVILLGSSEGHP